MFTRIELELDVRGSDVLAVKAGRLSNLAKRPVLLLLTVTLHLVALLVLMRQHRVTMVTIQPSLVMISLDQATKPSEPPVKTPKASGRPIAAAAPAPLPPPSEWSRSTVQVAVTEDVSPAAAPTQVAATAAPTVPAFGPDPYAGAATLTPAELAQLANRPTAKLATLIDKRLDATSVTMVLTWFSKVAPEAHGSASFVLTVGQNGGVQSAVVQSGSLPHDRAELLAQMMISALKLSKAAPNAGKLTIGPVTFG